MEDESSSLDMDLMEEREEPMVFPSEKDRTLIKTPFLKPFVTSIDGSIAELPHRRRRLSVSASSHLKHTFSAISFTGFWFAGDRFKSWAAKMEALHEPTWRKAGIFEAIKASTHKILKNQSLLLALVEKWCPETKSFVFPWGEATITLEDVMVILGFSVLGTPVVASLESAETRDSVEKLEKARQEIMNSAGRAGQEKWFSSFRNRDDQTEHEAFLALWLSHYVFPDKSHRSVLRNVLPFAVRLSRGERIALAVPVLASVYRDLGQIRSFARDDDSTKSLVLTSLFKLVQVWAWERFKNVRPEAKEIPRGEPRISRWGGLQKKLLKDVRLSLDGFDWRPYTKPLKNWNPLRVYVEEAMWITINNNVDDEFVVFARCVRSSQLVGNGFVEDYNPNRVAMQFGLSQDLPGLVSDHHHRELTIKEAWEYYNQSLDGLKLYMPSRLATTSVTARYREWWLKSVSKYLAFEESSETCNASNTDDDASLKVLPLDQLLRNMKEGFPAKLRRRRTRRLTRKLRYEIKKGKISDFGGSASIGVPLGRLFQKELVKRTSDKLRNKRGKRGREEISMDYKDDGGDDDNMPIAQLIKSREKSGGNAFESLGKRRRLELVSGHDEEGTISKAEKVSVLVLSDDENNSLDSPLVASNRVFDEKKDGGDDDYEGWKQRALAIDELTLKLDADKSEVQPRQTKLTNDTAEEPIGRQATKGRTRETKRLQVRGNNIIKGKSKYLKQKRDRSKWTEKSRTPKADRSRQKPTTSQNQQQSRRQAPPERSNGRSAEKEAFAVDPHRRSKDPASILTLRPKIHPWLKLSNQSRARQETKLYAPIEKPGPCPKKH
ncbi:unnamed protein product [Microthlaspi erraticum]|uniref:Aminotransferase-like plant mobile domain-containing protein n=1 Tax=Microthlaspi erraticum TaxID=1685480 RepID=A0A6D2K8G8_9BRAS|nr:unnamed protein product [Microthlaspi erraticum]